MANYHTRTRIDPMHGKMIDLLVDMPDGSRKLAASYTADAGAAAFVGTAMMIQSSGGTLVDLATGKYIAGTLDQLTGEHARPALEVGQLWSMADGGTARVTSVGDQRATLKWASIGVTGATIGRVFDVDLDGKAYSRTGVRFEKRDLVECIEQA